LFSASVPVQFLWMHPLHNVCMQVSSCRRVQPMGRRGGEEGGRKIKKEGGAC
jgi:hypothetical protein